MAKLHNHSAKFTCVLRAIVNAKFTTSTIPKLEETALALDSNTIAGNHNAYESLLDAYSASKALTPGKQVHAHIILTGLNQDSFLKSKLLNFYVMCENLKDARQLFDTIPKQITHAFLWNVMIKGYASGGFSEKAIGMYYQMYLVGIEPDNFTFPFVLKACTDISALQEGMEIQGYIIKGGFESDVYVGNGFIALYMKCGCTEDARQVFDKMAARDVVSWNSMIAGYAQNRCCYEALELFNQMESAGVIPNHVTLVSVLPVCADLEALQEGKNIHDSICRFGFDSHVTVGNALIDMYAKCGVLEAACQVFDNMSERNVISWNAIIAGFARAGYSDKSLDKFCHMQKAGVEPDAISVANVLPSCTLLGALRQGYAQNCLDQEALNFFRQMQIIGSKMASTTITNFLPVCARLASLYLCREIHGYIIRNGFDSDTFVNNGLIDMYAKCRSLELAYKVFDIMSPKDIISFNSMIAGYAQSSHHTRALELFRQMEQSGMKPDSVTILSILMACAHLSTPRQGKEIHNYIIRNAYELHVFVSNSLIDMYAKCGNIETAKLLFDRMPQRDVASWNTMISAYGIQGRSKDALQLFHQMEHAGLKPNHITFVAVLFACSHAGLVDDGWRYFDCMCQNCIPPQREHYACMVDLLGRAGQLNEALDIINKMPFEPDANMWGALLAACRIHSNIELGERVADHLFEMDPENTGYYVLMSNIYAAAGRWGDVTKVRKLMEERGLKKKPGWSWIEVDSRVHAFLIGDTSHPQSENIYAILKSLSLRMKEVGYVPDTRFVLHDVEEYT
ncbi:pentatricopeptide repeat-containing protein DOT4, chloroplastic-like isoform X2 [Cryptomeria japonica]|uniref:pentatricopeptide repeat-containing protein DOT4, chloroplastic-like isoform X2 n=1 Tax=Cryptomeria japonica TaxID=3369 RepID=UPI0027DA808F|nr:pentatricopeptide repeat-containing protein DOT4, chloroplastic-like isoform X2 [Cryptomeria japonica]